MQPRTGKSQVLAPKRPHKRPYTSARSGKLSTDLRMRSPSPARPHDASAVGLDDDPTSITGDDEEWTDEAPAAHDKDIYFRWEEESTLVSDLLEEATPGAGDAKLTALAESLQGPFDEESRQLKKDIAKTFVPLVNKVKDIFASIGKNVDIPFGAGLLAANDAYKEAEKSFAVGAGVVQKARAEHRKHIAGLLQQLEEECARREQLWINFQQAVDELVNPVLEMLNEAPAQMERSIATIEKHGRALDREGGSASAEVTAQALQEVLRKLRP